MNSASTKPGKYFNEQNSDNTLNSFSPKITFFLNNLLVKGDNSAAITLGNFRQLKQQHRHLNLILWMKLNGIYKEYSYISSEINHITIMLNSFLKQLELALNIEANYDKTTEEIIGQIIELLKDMKNNSTLLDPKNEMDTLLKNIEECRVNFIKMQTIENFHERLLSISNIFVHLGYTKALLNSKLSVIDPLSKKTLKKQYCGEAKTIFQNISRCYVLQNKLYSNTDDTIHPYHDEIEDKIKELDVKNSKLEKYVAVRPVGVHYNSVVTAINHAFSTILSEETVTANIISINNLIEHLIKALSTKEAISKNVYSSKLSQNEFLITSYENLLQEWSKFRSSHPDVIEPLLCNVTEFLYGFRMKVSLLNKLLIEYDNRMMEIDIQEDMTNFIKFPILDNNQISYEKHLDLLTNKKIGDFIEKVLYDSDNPYIAKTAVFRLWKCGMIETFNHCIMDGKINDNLNKNAFMKFTELINAFVDSWNKQQDEKEQRQREAESLYKTRTKCEEKTDDQQTEEEIQQLFSSHYTSDFGDLQKDATLSDDVEMQETPEDKYKDIITFEDLKQVMELHLILVRNFTKTEWLNPDKEKQINCDFVAPLIEKFKIFAPVLRKIINGLETRMDSELIGSLNVLLAVTQGYGQMNDLVDKSPSATNKISSDFYKDPNVEETKSAYHILEEFKLRVLELLNEWPEQPTLKTILTVIERIYSFDITSPLSRFLTGFEILLSKCHEWEEVAHSGVSLSQFYKSLVDQIIAWRKLELAMWKDLLNRTFEKLNESIPTWWLYLYNVMRQFVLERQFDKKELVETLQKFITQSNLGEFQSRLDLLHAFHCHATYLDRTQESQDFVNVLWNLYSYFKQYSNIVSNKIRDLRVPIEKKLKDYVKIVKWKDISYWSVKETMDKSHKTLHKYMKEFQEVLKQPVSSFLTNIDSKNESDNIGIWDRPQRQNPKTYHYTLDADAYLAKQSLVKKIQSSTSAVEEGLLTKTDSYFTKSRKLCKDIIQNTKYPSLVGSLDSFITDVIDSSTHLQNLEVDTTQPKDKQKSQAKNILQQKHRALADLFKALSKLGLSFRSGIISSKLKNPAEDFYIKPLDLAANFSHMNIGHIEKKILTIWDSCEIYFARSLIRNDILETALINPAKDLGLQNIERCRGFSMELLSLAQQQKVSLIESTRTYYYLKYYANHIGEFCEDKQFLPINIFNDIKNLLKNTTLVLAQFKIILNSCPPEDVFGSEMPELPMAESAVTFKYTEGWTKATNVINNTVSSVKKLNMSLLKCENLVPYTEFDLVNPEFIPVLDLVALKNELSSIQRNVKTLNETIREDVSTKSLEYLETGIGHILSQFDDDLKENAISTEEISKKIEKLTENILIVIQNLYKKYNTATEEQEIAEESEETEEDLLQDEHLKKLLVENLSEDMAILDMKKILRKIHKISSLLFKTSPRSQNFKDIVSRCVPLLEQILCLYQYFVTQQVSAYRVTSKITSILLNIFIELASKGFCIPPELSDEMDSEGISKPSDGLGLGEGEGEKDVSDKIESEDQLDDAQPAGQEKEQKDQDCKEEEKGIEMSEDFDSKLQDKEKENPEEDDEKSSDDSDADEQMGDTGKGADQLDQEVWGSDKEDEPEEETDDKEEKGNKGEKEGEDQLGAKDENPNKETEDDDKSEQKSEKEKEKNKKDINEMEEPEYDDEQIDPHHGKQPELPEPEPMDLPDDLQLDEGEDKEEQEETNEENPFDIDTMKEQNQPEDKTEEEKEDEGEKETDEQKDFSSDDEDITKKDQADEEDDNTEDKKMDEQKEEEKKEEGSDQVEQDKEGEDEEQPNNEESVLDQTQSRQEQVEAMEVDNAEAADNAQNNQSSTMESSQPIEDIAQENEPDKEGAGQSQMEESSTGHTAQTTASQQLQQSKKEIEEREQKKQKPGDSDSKRALGDIDEPVAKKLKTMKADETEKDKELKDSNEADASEIYQHIKEAKEETKQILDVATKEQAESQKKEVPNKDDEDVDMPTESSEDLPVEEDVEELETPESKVQEAEKSDISKENQSKKKQHPQGDILEDVETIDVEGDIVETSTVARSDETTYHTQYSDTQTTISRLTAEEMNTLRLEVESQLSSWNEPPSTTQAEQTWQKISSVTSSLAQDLSEQLRLVLEPTQATRLKGDFRTGRRINMRKVIPYIASQFRKDKIWLRRTKPSKREYQIVIAIDDSSSMADNHSKELAFESVALISKALTLLESGQLSVISFGERVEVLHKLTDQFTDKSGVKLLQKFQFDQSKTAIAKLVDFSTEMFGQSQIHTTALNAKLLIIVSDGRGVFSEGEANIRQAVRRAKLANIFMVFVIVDNPENKNSILDIRMPVFKDGKLLNIQSYMDVFPFSFYIILKNINSLPNVLSDALRQWFEIVSSDAA